MPDVTKLTEEEYKELITMQAQWTELTKRYGELHYQKKLVEADLKATDEALDQLDEIRVQSVTNLQEKYGTGQVNLTTGEFIPDALTT